VAVAGLAGPACELVELAVDAAMTLAVTTPETERDGGGSACGPVAPLMVSS
jgi:hypothetical protein